MRLRRVVAGTFLLVLGCGREPPHLTPPSLPPVPTLDAHTRAWQQHGGARDARCIGASIDPPDAELAAAAERATRGDLDGAYAAHLALAVAWPKSATVRVRAAAIASESSHEADAARLFADALALDDAGCTPPPREEWIALRGLASAHARAGEWQAARPYLERARTAFPAAVPTRYELACALCRAADVTGCATELDAALTHAAAGDAPSFVTAVDDRDLAAWLTLARSDDNLAPLRRDPRFAEIVARHSPPVGSGE